MLLRLPDEQDPKQVIAFFVINELPFRIYNQTSGSFASVAFNKGTFAIFSKNKARQSYIEIHDSNIFQFAKPKDFLRKEIEALFFSLPKTPRKTLAKIILYILNSQNILDGLLSIELLQYRRNSSIDSSTGEMILSPDCSSPDSNPFGFDLNYGNE